ncbi:MAG TPA: hypothetical protein VD793_10250 [Gemmatimonadales bacterium]|nr:hypothetical protein [Gemmatimonadales bacterium]
MITPKLLLPLRIPELGPSLGKLVTGTGRRPGGMSLDAARIALVTKIIERAGEARRLAANDERAAAIAALGRDTWLSAWEETVTAIGQVLLTRARERLAAEAVTSRMPRRRRRALVPGESEWRAVAARLGASGAGLIPALDKLDALAPGAREATPAGRADLEAWQEALRAAARRMEEAWLALEDAVERESGVWERLANAVASWRPSVWPVVAVVVVALVLAVGLGLVWGGVVPAPRWLLPILRRLPSL